MEIKFTMPREAVIFGIGFFIGWMVRAMLASFGIF